jgi:hypothetical protein
MQRVHISVFVAGHPVLDCGKKPEIMLPKRPEGLMIQRRQESCRLLLLDSGLWLWVALTEKLLAAGFWLLALCCSNSKE